MLAYFDVSIGWSELFRRTVRGTQKDNALGLAAQLAYYFFLALFPALLSLVALAGLLPQQGLVARVVSMLDGMAPPAVVTIIRDQLAQIASSGTGGILTFGVVAALWSSSAAMVALIDALNRAYDAKEGRPWWRRRLTAILLTLGAAAFILVSITLVVAGPELAAFVGAQVGLSDAFVRTWTILQWPLVFVLVTTAIGLIYAFAPDVDQDFVWMTPGSLLAAALWLLGSLGFRIYVVNFGSYVETYGVIGGVIVLMLWLYLSGLAIVVGAEMNAEIEHAAPHGSERGPAPGGRRAIGPRAARAWRNRRRGEAPAPAAARPRVPWQPAAAMARTGIVVSGVIAALVGRRVHE